MAQKDLDSFFNPALVPSFALRSIDVGSHHCAGNSLFAKNTLQACSHVPLLRVYSKHLAAPPLRKFALDFLNQPAFLGVHKLFRQVAGSCYQKTMAMS